MSDSVTVSVKYMLPGHSVKDFSTFDKDFSGRPLRYQILVKDQQIFKILYNQGEGIDPMEVPFEEKRLKLGEVFLVPPTIAG